MEGAAVEGSLYTGKRITSDSVLTAAHLGDQAQVFCFGIDGAAPPSNDEGAGNELIDLENLPEEEAGHSCAEFKERYLR